MKNELPVFFIRKPDYTLFGYVTIYLQWLVMSNLRHLDVVMAKTGLTPCGLDPVFFFLLKNQGHKMQSKGIQRSIDCS